MSEWQKLSHAMSIPCQRHEVRGRPGFLFEPSAPAPGRPWVFYAPTFAETYPTERQAWIFTRALAAGIAIAGVDVGESFGNPEGRDIFDAWHGFLCATRGYAPRAVLVPQSRGGLMLYSWAADHPEKASGVTAIYAVTDLSSFPGLEKASPAYGMSAAELAASLARYNPVDRLEPLARRRVPIWHIHGAVDTVVPIRENAEALVRRYRALGGPAELLVVPGKGHEEHASFFECEALVESIRSQSR
jgi:pimeloyl-ACP methyl ester carboxylesterase